MTDPRDVDNKQSDGYELHPAAKLFPFLGGEEFEQLVADIKAHGLLEPLALDREGRLLDGRNRWAACIEAGIEPTTKKLTLTGEEAWAFVVSKNIRRRHLDTATRLRLLKAMPEVMLEAIEREAKQKKRDGQKAGGRGKKKLESHVTSKFSAAQEKAKAVGLSESTVKRFEEVEKKAPALAEQVLDNEVSLGEATKQVRAKKAPPTKATPATPEAEAAMAQVWGHETPAAPSTPVEVTPPGEQSRTEAPTQRVRNWLSAARRFVSETTTLVALVAEADFSVEELEVVQQALRAVSDALRALPAVEEVGA